MENYGTDLTKLKLSSAGRDRAGVTNDMSKSTDERPDRASGGPMSKEAVKLAGTGKGQEVVFDTKDDETAKVEERQAVLEGLSRSVSINRRDAVNKFKDRVASILDTIPESFQYLFSAVNARLLESAKRIDGDLRSVKPGEVVKLEQILDTLNLLEQNVKTVLAINKRLEKLSGFLNQTDAADLAGQLNLAMDVGKGGIDKDLLADLEEDLVGYEKAYRARPRVETQPKYDRPAVTQPESSFDSTSKDQMMDGLSRRLDAMAGFADDKKLDELRQTVRMIKETEFSSQSAFDEMLAGTDGVGLIEVVRQLEKQVKIQQLKIDLQSLQAGYDKTANELDEAHDYDVKTGKFRKTKGLWSRMIGGAAKALGVGKVSSLVDELVTLSDRMSQLRAELRKLGADSEASARKTDVSQPEGTNEVLAEINVSGEMEPQQRVGGNLAFRTKSVTELSTKRDEIIKASETNKGKSDKGKALDSFSPEELKELGDLVSARVEAKWPRLKENLTEAVLAEKYDGALDILANEIIFFSLEIILRKHSGNGRTAIARGLLDRMATLADYFAGQALKDMIVGVHNKGAQQPISVAEQLKVWYPYFGDQTRNKQKLKRLRLEKGIEALGPQELADLINNKLMSGTPGFNNRQEQEVRQAQAA